MDILIRVPINRKVKSPHEIEDEEKRKPTKHEKDLWGLLTQMSKGYSQPQIMEVGKRTAKYKLILASVWGVTLADMETAISQFGEDWHILHSEDDEDVEVPDIDPDTQKQRKGKDGNLLTKFEKQRVVKRAGVLQDMLDHTEDEHDFDSQGNITATRKATVPNIGAWAGRDKWQV